MLAQICSWCCKLAMWPSVDITTSHTCQMRQSAFWCLCRALRYQPILVHCTNTLRQSRADRAGKTHSIAMSLCLEAGSQRLGQAESSVTKVASKLCQGCMTFSWTFCRLSILKSALAACAMQRSWVTVHVLCKHLTSLVVRVCSMLYKLRECVNDVQHIFCNSCWQW